MAYANTREYWTRCTKIYAIFGTVTERDFRKKSIAQKQDYNTVIQIDAMLHSGFFPKNAMGDAPTLWIFQKFRDKD